MSLHERVKKIEQWIKEHDRREEDLNAFWRVQNQKVMEEMHNPRFPTREPACETPPRKRATAPGQE